MDNQKQ